MSKLNWSIATGENKNLKYVSLILLVATISLVSPVNSAVISKDQNCSVNKVGQVIKSGNSYLICKKTGSKSRWNLSTVKAFKSYKARMALKELARLNSIAVEFQKAQAAKELELAQAAKELELAQAVRHYIEGQAQRDSIAKGAGYRCVIGKYCSVGNYGPGGGIVFIGNGIAGNGIHYEIALRDWSTSEGEPQEMYCVAKDGIMTINGFNFDGSNEPILQYPGKAGIVYANNRIGDGKDNTRTIIERCKESAASKASSYQGGGYSDWFLPSVAELIAAYEVRDKIVDMQPKPYWSSSEILGGGRGIAVMFDDSGENVDLPIGSTCLVRPIRNF